MFNKASYKIMICKNYEGDWVDYDDRRWASEDECAKVVKQLYKDQPESAFLTQLA